MPIGGELTQAIGLQLQSQTPGNADNGNFNVSGVGIMQQGAYPVWQPVGGTLPVDQRIIAIGQTSTWTFTGTANQNNYTGGVYIGQGLNLTSNVNGNPNLNNVVIGAAHNIYAGRGTTIGYNCTNGTINGYPNPWAQSVVIGMQCKAKTMSDVWGSVVIGCFNNESIVGSAPTGPNIFIGSQITSGTQAGKNTVLGTGITIVGTNNINIGHYNLVAIDTYTENNTIRIGDNTHTGGIWIGPLNFTNGFASAVRAVADTNTTATSADGTIQYSSITAARTVTLPAASAVSNGFRLLVVDISGSASGVNTITLTRAGADTINGGTTSAINTGYGCREVTSDGVSKWTVIRSL